MKVLEDSIINFYIQHTMFLHSCSILIFFAFGIIIMHRITVLLSNEHTYVNNHAATIALVVPCPQFQEFQHDPH